MERRNSRRTQALGQEHPYLQHHDSSRRTASSTSFSNIYSDEQRSAFAVGSGRNSAYGSSAAGRNTGRDSANSGSRVAGNYNNTSDYAYNAASSRGAGGRGNASRGGYGGGSRRPGNSGNSGNPSTFVVPGRMWIFLVVFAIIAVIFAGRLLWLQVINSENILAKGSERAQTETIEAKRGTIYDRDGTVLAISVDAYHITCRPNQIDSDDIDTITAALVEVLEGEAASYEEDLTNGEDFAYVYKYASEEEFEALYDLGLFSITGMDYEETTKREYPCGSTASQVIGLLSSDGEALSGLELQYDDILRGTDGEKTTEYSQEGVEIPGTERVTVEVVDGQDIVISIDIDLQAQLEEALLVRVEEVSGSGGSGIIMDAETGEIYACASSPTFDITDTSSIEEGATNLTGISSSFEPGSIMKPVTMLAALEEGTVTLDSSYYCPASITLDEYTITDSHERAAETMTVTSILANSSNIGMSLIAKDLTFETLYDYIQGYELTDLTGVDYPGEASGSITTSDTWSIVQGYNIAFGQGLTVTPIEMVRFYGALANDGVATTPHFLLYTSDDSGVRNYDTTTLTKNTDALDSLETMMEAVVTEGTATDAAIEGYTVVGKTGTAQIASSDGGYKSGVYNISFVGYLPDSSTNLVCFLGATDVPSESKMVSTYSDIMTYAIKRYSITQE